MKISLSGKDFDEITIRDLVDGYTDNAEEGVVGYGGKLNIRPAYQREFIYKDDKRNEVIRTVNKNFPLNTMYWAKTEDDSYEMIDGQQRTISVCQYVAGDFDVEIDGITKYFHSLTKDQQEKILDYPLSIYICEGTYDEKIDWFNIINIAGEELTKQELRNANFTGKWLTDAKRWFSKSGAPAAAIGDKYVSARRDRQEYLELAICWIVGCSKNDEAKIESYMSKHQHEADASELWEHYQKVIDWVVATFPNYRNQMKGLPWGQLYDAHHERDLDPEKLEAEILKLIEDDDVQSVSGIYQYVLSGDERYLNLRAFDEKTKHKVYETQKGICVAKNAVCGNTHFEFSEMEADHITPWHEGGKTIVENCQMLCRDDNRRKSGK